MSNGDLDKMNLAVPAADSSANTQLRDVVGNKSDTISGDSIVALAKQIKAKTDNLPTDPADDSDIDGQLAVIDGFHDVPDADAVTNAQMRDVIGNKSDTVSGDSLVALVKTADAAVDTINTNLGDPAGDTLTSINAKLGDVSEAIGTTVGTLNTSIGDPSGDTLTSLVAKIGDSASTLVALITGVENYVENAFDTGASHNVTVVHDTAEQDVVEIAKAGTYALSVFIDLSALVTAVEGGTIIARLYNKIDETNYREIAASQFIVGTDTTHPSIEANMVNHNCKVTLQMGSAVTGTRAVPYKYIVRDLGA